MKSTIFESDTLFWKLIHHIAAGKKSEALKLLKSHPELVKHSAKTGATRVMKVEIYLETMSFVMAV